MYKYRVRITYLCPFSCESLLFSFLSTTSSSVFYLDTAACCWAKEGLRVLCLLQLFDLRRVLTQAGSDRTVAQSYAHSTFGMDSAVSRCPNIFFLDDTILVLYSFLTNSESLKFRLVNKSVHYNLKLLPSRKSYSTVIGWKKHKNVVRALSIFSRYFPHSEKLVFTHFSSDDIDKEDAIAIATLYPDIKELVVGELACPYAATAATEDISNYSPTRNYRRRNIDAPNDRNVAQETFKYTVFQDSEVLKSFAKRMQYLQVLSLLNVGGDMTEALNVLISSCNHLVQLNIGNSALRCECGWEVVTKAFCAFRCLEKFHFEGHLFHHYPRDAPLEFLSDLQDVRNLKSLSIGGRFTARMIRDTSSIFHNLSELSLGRVSDTTLRALLDVYGGEDIGLQSLSLSARLSPSLTLSMIISFLRQCKNLKKFRGCKFHSVNHHLINTLTSLNVKDGGLEEISLVDYANWNSGQPTDLAKKRMIGSFLNLRSFSFMNLSDDLLITLSTCCPLLDQLVIQNSPRVTKKSIATIGGFRHLNNLAIQKTKMTCIVQVELMRQIGYRLKKLQIINYCEDTFDDFAIASILSHCRKAYQVSIKSVSLSLELIEMLAKMASQIQKNLQLLELGECSIEFFEKLKDVLPYVLIHATILE